MGVLEDVDLLLQEIKSNLLILNEKKIQNEENYATEFLHWIKEMTVKNKLIYENKGVEGKTDQETYKKYRQHVYWINFGKNIGSEFNDFHFAVVVKESYFTAIVVPISTEKETEQAWKIKEDLIIPIGELNLPKERKPAYAMIHQIQAVSKKRLDRCGGRATGYYELELTDDQMNIIDNAIVKLLANK